MGREGGTCEAEAQFVLVVSQHPFPIQAHADDYLSSRAKEK